MTPDQSMNAVEYTVRYVARLLELGEALKAPATENEARDIVLQLTGGNRTDVVPFGTEAGIFASLGMSTVVCGPGSIEQAHKPDEYLALTQLQECLKMLDGLENRMSG